MVIQAIPVKDTPNASNRMLRFLHPFISLNIKIPQREATIPGPDVMIGNATIRLRVELATNHATSAVAQITPEKKP